MRAFVIVSIFTLASFSGQAQTDIRVQFENTPFEQVVHELEAQYDLSFYYQKAWVDQLGVNFTAEKVNLPTFLDSVFSLTNLSYVIQDGRKIILTQGFSVNSTLADDFWDKDRKAGSTPYQVPVPKQTSSPSNKLSKATDQVLELGSAGIEVVGQEASIAGYVRDINTGEPISGVSVFIEEPQIGVITDAFGHYVINLPTGNHTIYFKYVGKLAIQKRIKLNGDGQLDLEMEEEVLSLKEVVISGEKSQVESLQTGLSKLSIAEIKAIPTLFGEADVLKVSLNLPGVQSVGEGSSGFHVRGGSVDQNLILLNDATIYNPNHLFGFFSAFNPAVIRSADLYKSGIQAQYGGRISSVMDVSIRDGNKKKFVMGGGIGPITSKLHVEGPMLNQKASYLLGARSTYANWLLRAIDNPSISNSKAFFGDLIGKLNYQVNDQNNLIFSVYSSRDNFRLNADTLYKYQNNNMALRWRHRFGNKLSSQLSTSYSQYGYQLESEESKANAFGLTYGIGQYAAKLDFDYYPSSKHHIRFGIRSILYDLEPGQTNPLGDSSLVASLQLDREMGLESAIYLGDEIVLSPRLSLYGGLRLSVFSALGPGKVRSYAPNLPREIDFITDTTFYSNGELIKTYFGPEFRFSSRYKLDDEMSLKLSYDRTFQYIHMLSNTIAVSPTDTWRLSGQHIRPQMGDQLAVGLYKEFAQNGIEFSVEAYFKRLQNLLEYKDGANLLINEVIETDVIAAKGRSYGAELLLKKKAGQLNGWISYTYSRSLIQTQSPYESEQINGGAWYPANYDKPHNLSIIANYKYNRRLNISLNLNYSTGRPITLPIGQYQLKGSTLAYFSERNQYRIPDYFRMDLAINVEGNHKIKKLGHSSWSFSIYNLTGRRNPYSVFSRRIDKRIDTYRLAIFGTPIPTFIYNFELR